MLQNIYLSRLPGTLGSEVISGLQDSFQIPAGLNDADRSSIKASCASQFPVSSVGRGS